MFTVKIKLTSVKLVCFLRNKFRGKILGIILNVSGEFCTNLKDGIKYEGGRIHWSVN